MMAKDEKTEEELKAEAAKAEEAKAEEAKKEESPEISKEALEVQTKFDEQMDSDDDDPAVEEAAKEGVDEKVDEKVAEEKPAEEKPGEEEAGEQTAEEKELQDAQDAIEKEAAAEAGKTDADRQAESEAKVAAEAKAAEAKKDADKPYDCGLDPEEFDADYIKALNTMGQGYQDDKKAMKAENAELRQTVSAQANQRYADWLDRKVNALGEDFVEVLGEGEFEDLTPGSKQSDNRIKIGNRMHLISLAHQRLNKAVPSRNKLFDQAVSFEFKKVKNKSKTEAKTKEKLEARSGQVLGSGSQKASKQSAEAAALKVQTDFDEKMDTV